MTIVNELLPEPIECSEDQKWQLWYKLVWTNVPWSYIKKSMLEWNKMCPMAAFTGEHFRIAYREHIRLVAMGATRPWKPPVPV
jgi:hypothetical protein